MALFFAFAATVAVGLGFPPVHGYHAHVGFAASMFPGNLSSQCATMATLKPCRLFTTWNSRMPLPNGTASAAEQCAAVHATAAKYNVTSYGLMVRGWPAESDFQIAACLHSPTIAAYGPSNTYDPIPSYLGPLVAKYGVRVAMHTQEQGANMTIERWATYMADAPPGVGTNLDTVQQPLNLELSTFQLARQ